MTESNNSVAIWSGMYGVIEGTGLMYETSKPMLPRTTSIKVLIAPRINPVFLNGNEKEK